MTERRHITANPYCPMCGVRLTRESAAPRSVSHMHSSDGFYFQLRIDDACANCAKAWKEKLDA